MELNLTFQQASDMKKILFNYSALLFLTYLLCSCTEIGPYINLKPDQSDTILKDTSYISSQFITATPKKVLISDFTGVRCPNCPNAAKKIHELDSAYPGRLVAIALHVKNNPFTTPHIPTADYRTWEATQIFDLLGKSGALPIGAIDQVKFLTESQILVNVDKWTNYFLQRISTVSPVNIIITPKAVVGQNRTYIVNVKTEFHLSIPNETFLTVAITESGMKSPQTQPDGHVDSLYEHKHVLRTTLTDPRGNLLMNNPEINRVIIKEFKITIPAEWDENNCEVNAYVHRNASVFDVYQAESVKLK